MDFSKIPVAVLFIVSLICCIAQQTSQAYYIKRKMKRESEQYSLNAGMSIVCALTLFFLGGCSLKASWYSVFLGVLFGIVSMMCSIFRAKAIKIGPFGYTSVIVNLSTAITALSGALFWNESLGVFKIIGIVLMIGSFFFAIDTENDDGKKANVKWFILCLLALLFISLIGIMQKVHQTSEYKNEVTAFLCVAFLTSSIISFVGYVFTKKNENKSKEEQVTTKKWLWFLIALAICGIGAAGNNILNLYLSGVMDTAIFFPIANGVPLFTSLLVSVLVFREKLKRKQLLGMSIGIIAIICLFI